MAFNVTNFRTGLIGDGARPNLFDIQLQFPNYAALGSLASAAINIQGKAAQMPGATIGMAPLYYFGREVKLAGNRTWQDWTVQVINDEPFVIRNAFEQWINGINDPVNNVRDPAATIIDGGYGTDALITHYGKTGDVIKVYNLVGMFPIDVAPIELDWGANDQIEEFVVTFAFQYGYDPTL